MLGLIMFPHGAQKILRGGGRYAVDTMLLAPKALRAAVRQHAVA